METETLRSAGWAISGFQAVLALGGWVVLVLLHGFWRWLLGPETDPIRPTGPIL